MIYYSLSERLRRRSTGESLINCSDSTWGSSAATSYKGCSCFTPFVHIWHEIFVRNSCILLQQIWESDNIFGKFKGMAISAPPKSSTPPNNVREDFNTRFVKAFVLLKNLKLVILCTRSHNSPESLNQKMPISLWNSITSEIITFWFEKNTKSLNQMRG